MNDTLAILSDKLIGGQHSELEQLQLLMQRYGPFDLGNDMTLQSSSLTIDVLDNSATQDAQFDGDDFIRWLRSNATLNPSGNDSHTEESNETAMAIPKGKSSIDDGQLQSTQLSPGKLPQRVGTANATRLRMPRDQPDQSDALPTKPTHLRGEYSSITLVSGSTDAKFTFPIQMSPRRAHWRKGMIVRVAKTSDWVVIRTETQHIPIPAEGVPNNLKVGDIVEFTGIDRQAGQRLRLADGAELVEDEAINSPSNEGASGD